MLELAFYNIFVNGLFLFPEETFLSNSAYYNTLSARNVIYKVEKTLSNDLGIIGNWFYVKIMVPNLKKQPQHIFLKQCSKLHIQQKEVTKQL